MLSPFLLILVALINLNAKPSCYGAKTLGFLSCPALPLLFLNGFVVIFALVKASILRLAFLISKDSPEILLLA